MPVFRLPCGSHFALSKETPMTAIDPRAALRAPIDFAHKNLVNDLNALTEEQAAGSTKEGARSAISVVAECASVNSRLAEFVSTGTFPSLTPEQRAAFYAGITTRAQALSALEASVQTLRAAIDACPPEKWGEPVTDIFGMPSTVFGIANFASMHMMYHDGQLNYLHTVHGDTEMHW